MSKLSITDGNQKVLTTGCGEDSRADLDAKKAKYMLPNSF
jgi:hypothetical protein